MSVNEKPAVWPNQVWADNDWRSEGRTLRVIRTDETHALCEVLTDSVSHRAYVANGVSRSRVGTTARIALKRFRPTSTGYREIRTTTPAKADR